MSLFSDWLEELGVDIPAGIEDVEPEEITWLCNDPVFRAIADYCTRSRGYNLSPQETFDADELGLDPEVY